ncbi:hypothetical protein WJX72_004969 [[Myrmecia] bisecta]|uniref:RCC1-like domain-containing protein n=1 Tax=[Myrmecia] bisecta TaxID=41462 RepID=A0AAW1Q535_9CHLO
MTAPPRLILVLVSCLIRWAGAEVGQSYRLYAWGRLFNDKLGAAAQHTNRPILLATLPSGLVKPVAQAPSQYVSVVTAAGLASGLPSGHGGLFTWRWNQHTAAIPSPNAWLNKSALVRLAAGHSAVAAVMSDGRLYTWGSNHAGQLGKGDFRQGTVDVPLHVSIPGTAAHMAVGHNYMLAVSHQGRVFGWGRNDHGQLGIASRQDQYAPQELRTLHGLGITHVAAGMSHSLALGADGTVYAWGYNEDYQLGLQDRRERLVPAVVQGLPGNIASIAAGAHHSLAISKDGVMYAWGCNSYGQRGEGNPAQSGGTHRLDVWSEDQQLLAISQVVAGTWHSLCLTENGHVYAWGRCDSQQLGLSSPCPENGFIALPQRVELPYALGTVMDMAAGAAYGAAVVVPPT